MNLSFYKNIKYSTLGNIIVLLFGLITVAVVSRNIAKTDLGYYAIALLTTNFIALFSDLGLEKIIISEQITQTKLLSYFKRRVLKTSILLFIISTLFSIALFLLIANKTQLMMMLVLSTTALFLGFTKLYVAILQREKLYNILSQIQIISSVVNLALTILLIFLGFGWWSLVISNVIAQSIALFLFRKQSPKKADSITSSTMSPSFYFAKGKVQLMERSFEYLYNQLDTVALPVLFSPAILAVFDYFKKSLNKPVQFFNNAINDPIFSEMGTAQPYHKEKLLIYHTNIYATVSFFFFGFCMLFSSTIVPLFFGESWSEYSMAFTLISIGLAILGVSRPIGNYWFAIDKYKRSLFWKVFTSLAIFLFYVCCFYLEYDFMTVFYLQIVLYSFLVIFIQYFNIIDLTDQYLSYLIAIAKPLVALLCTIAIVYFLKTYIFLVPLQMMLYILLMLLLTILVNKQAYSFFINLYRSL